MATLDLSTAARSFSMIDPSGVGFNRQYQTDPNFWLFNTPDAHAVRLTGNGLTYDAQGRAQTGLINAISIDLGNDNASSPDIKITGINADAKRLDDGPADFWHFLEGNDTILGPQVSQGASAAPFTLVGDGSLSRPGAQVGGHDVIHSGDGTVSAFGDVFQVGSSAAGSPTSSYRGGNDKILGLETLRHQALSGDAGYVNAGSKLTGGDDTIVIQSSSGSSAAGDAYLAGTIGGASNVLTQVIGGNDTITAGPNFHGTLIGDVMEQRAGSLVRGGADTIHGGELADTIVGDVQTIDTARLIGGNDILHGNGGRDYIYGDSFRSDGNSSITGGNDRLYGGRGDDYLVGDFGDNDLNQAGGDDVLHGDSGKDILIGQSGNDQLYGGTENDRLYGGSGNDLLDGGTGADTLVGGTGNDTYFVNDNLDIVYEAVGEGRDTVVSFLDAYRLRGDTEDLSYNGGGNFTGIGNDLNNVIRGGAGADDLRGEAGNDLLIGGAGGDLFQGGAGIDTVSYADNSRGINVSLRGIGYGGDATGDRYVDVENFVGSRFADTLFGDDGANRLTGGAGDDYLQGHLGNDVLIGGAGADHLIGGLGNDSFDFNAVTESTANTGRDIIFDFTVNPASGGAYIDRIDVSTIDASAGLAGNQGFTFIGSGAFTGEGQIRAVQSGTNTILQFNTSGTGGAEMEVQLNNITVGQLTAADFIL